MIYMMKFVYSFAELNNGCSETFAGRYRGVIGSKAVSIIEMSASGIPVPDGYCVTVEAFRKHLEQNHIQFDPAADFDRAALEALEEKVLNGVFPQEILNDLRKTVKAAEGDCFAVRSSGIREDLKDSSFAGQYRTQLNVPADHQKLILNIQRIWASAFTPELYSYFRKQRNSEFNPEMGVIIQKMIPCQKSGVIFTVDPVSGIDREILIEACYGLGASLVDGLVTPDQYRYDWYNEKIVSVLVRDKGTELVCCEDPPYTRTRTLDPFQRNSRVLDETEITELSCLCIKIQSYYGFPVDIEWGKSGKDFYILQSRPITGIHTAGITGQWTTADFRDGGVSSGVCTAFMWSLYDYIWENTTKAYLDKVHLGCGEDGVKRGDMFYSRPYWNVTAIKDGLKKIPGFVEREFDEDLGIKVCYEGKGYVSKTEFRTVLHGIKVILALRDSFKTRLAENPLFMKRQEDRFRILESADPGKMTEQEFFEFYENLICREYFHTESNYFYNIFNNSNAQTLFREKISKLGTGIEVLSLMSGLTGISHLLPNFDLWEISRSILKDPDRRERWMNAEVSQFLDSWRSGLMAAADPDVAGYIEKYKYHSTRELDITVKNFDEDPEFIFRNLKSFLAMGVEQDPRINVYRQNYKFRKLRKEFLARLPFYRRNSVEKELDQCRELLGWREELRDQSTRMYYHIRKFTLHMSGIYMKKGICEEPDDIFHLRYQDIIEFNRGTRTKSDLLRSIRMNRLYYQSFRNYRIPWDIGAGREDETEYNPDSTLYKGVACSPGVVTGTARIIQDIFDSGRLKKGDILITRFTDPGWTPLFSMLSGVVTETGGILSHAAVISREYGIPAVLAIPGITTLILDGQTVTLDGTKGSVSIFPGTE